jgi:hypothetical protein
MTHQSKLLVKRVGTAIGISILVLVSLWRDGFGNSVASVEIKTPTDSQQSALQDGVENNPAIDSYMDETLQQLREACWKSGWRLVVSNIIFAAPQKVELTVSDSLGVRSETYDCTDL